jgi:Ca2+/H+ antiporter
LREADIIQILLLVYAVYLLFQLKSHAYMYESTPQHVIDEEATPGPVAMWLETSSSDSDSSSGSDSDSSGHSRDTMGRRMRRLMRTGRRRKSSVASAETAEMTTTPRTPSFGTATLSAGADEITHDDSQARVRLPAFLSNADDSEQAVADDESPKHHKKSQCHLSRRHNKHKKGPNGSDLLQLGAPVQVPIAERPEAEQPAALNPENQPRHVDFAVPKLEDPLTVKASGESALRRPFNGIRGLSLRPVAASLTPTVFTQLGDATATPAIPSGPVPRIRYGIRRTNSLPDLSRYHVRPPGAMLPARVPLAAINSGKAAQEVKHPEVEMSRLTAILLLIVSTALVAVCAEFMVDSIKGLEATTDVGEVFVGLIILPVVGNAAEFVTAVTVAMKNKMDLAIGVAVGSSIQVALFITPLVVVLGWIMDRDMTLYFTLFETISLAVSAFMVNFLVLDGRSNYLEGALLCATYVIIGLVAFFYPDADDATAMRM